MNSTVLLISKCQWNSHLQIVIFVLEYFGKCSLCRQEDLTMDGAYGQGRFKSVIANRPFNPGKMYSDDPQQYGGVQSTSFGKKQPSGAADFDASKSSRPIASTQATAPEQVSKFVTGTTEQEPDYEIGYQRERTLEDEELSLEYLARRWLKCERKVEGLSIEVARLQHLERRVDSMIATYDKEIEDAVARVKFLERKVEILENEKENEKEAAKKAQSEEIFDAFTRSSSRRGKRAK